MPDTLRSRPAADQTGGGDARAHGPSRTLSAVRANAVTYLSALATASVLIAAGAGCAREAGPDVVAATGPRVEASSEFLAAVSERSGAEPYRYEGSLTMGSGGAASLVPVMSITGEVEGERMSMAMDMGQMFETLGEHGDVPPELVSGEPMMEMVSDGQSMYIRAPVLAALPDTTPEEADGQLTGEVTFPPILAELDGDTWGRVDLDAVAGDLGTLDVTGGQNADPTAMLDLVAAADDPRELGGNRIQGVAVEGIGATITYGELVTGGGDVSEDEIAEQLRESMPDDLGPPVDDADLDAMFEAMFATEVPLEVWVDEAGLVRQFVFELEVGAMMSEVGEAIDEPDPPPFVPTMRMAMDFLDYGDRSIEIEIPAESVDITDEYVDQ
jgi:uncharacterized protein YciI